MWVKVRIHHRFGPSFWLVLSLEKKARSSVKYHLDAFHKANNDSNCLSKAVMNHRTPK